MSHIYFILLAFFMASVIVSYTEKFQVGLLMPLRNYFKVPKKQNVIINKEYTELGISYKSSEDGFYINPWMTALNVIDDVNQVLNTNCDNLTVGQKNRLIGYANYFISSVEYRFYQDQKFAVWTYPISFTYGLKPGWISAPAQGDIATLLYAAYICSGIVLYKNLVNEILYSFKVPILYGGVLAENNSSVWYEEYSQNGVTPPLVLNGHLVACIALGKLSKYELNADELFEAGLKSIKNNLKDYDAVTWSFYDKMGDPSNNIYVQQLHVKLMNELYQRTKDVFFLKYRNKFSLQLYFPFSSLQRILLRPTRFLVFLLGLNFTLIYLFIFLVYRYGAKV